MREKIFIFYEFFPPAFRSGGITRSLGNLAQFLSRSYDVYVFTSNQDLGEPKPLAVQPNIWVQWIPNVRVFYAERNHQSYGVIKSILQEINPHVIYINGLFTPRFSLFPLIIRKRTSIDAHWVIAPRGMLNEGALAIKSWKKKVYLKLLKLLGLFDGLTWHATDLSEKKGVLRFGIGDRMVNVTSNIPSFGKDAVLEIPKKPYKLTMVFLALISPIKNLDLVIKALEKIPNQMQVSLDIFGPIKDANYWDLCKSLIRILPEHITVHYRGEVLPDATHELLGNYHLFVMLSKGENFGHSIFEALNAGTPVLISDKTPWKNLRNQKSGLDLAIDSVGPIVRAIEEFTVMDRVQYQDWRKFAKQTADEFLKNNNFDFHYSKLFTSEKRR
ncbi:glycosyltransferase [Mongoliitalea lutea]|uniref:Glycosyl transferase family 1 domain-containing protein n=1 Tax=Mongoliitalea lutea TaxID=849756 RepID=A0A8J3CWN0_9BACT|nr:glycosyltransferase [Mongoliitalea lutea]GHB37070.1 hypothetical protein GCM10008106_17940 [Mongoliitalea lutea]